jgi:hypothetical protein
MNRLSSWQGFQNSGNTLHMSITWENDVETLEFSIDPIINLKDIVVQGLQKSVQNYFLVSN